MNERENRLFLEGLVDRLEDVERALGNQWPEIREMLMSIQRRMADTDDARDVSDGIDDIIDLLLQTRAEELTRAILQKALDDAVGTSSRGQLRGESRATVMRECFPDPCDAAQMLLDRLDPTSHDEWTVVPVLYATDREPTAKGHYGSGRGALEFGIASVSLPVDRRIGTLPKPRWWKFELSQDPSKHVILLDVATRERDIFVADIRQALAEDDEAGVLIFVHGYNTSFADAARRAAQLSYDLRYRGVPLLYSWPSVGRMVPYTVDATNVEWSEPHLKHVLTMLLDEANVTRMDIIAHSMGSRAVLGAVGALNLAATGTPLRHLILAAPDVDAGTFREAARDVARRASRFTLYASSRDWALWFSKRVNGYPRAGDSGDGVVIVRPSLDTIDASSVDTSLVGHSYYGDNRSIVSDIFALFQHHAAPPRFGMQERTTALGEYWLFRP
jgi:esterase/lipase superfamily enzyme